MTALPPITDDDLLELVRAADPLDGDATPLDADALLSEILATARTDGHAAKTAVINGHVGREAQRSVRSEYGEEARYPGRICDLGWRKHASVDDGQRVVSDLSPLPRDALPEAPVVIVIPHTIVEHEGFAARVEPPLHRA